MGAASAGFSDRVLLFQSLQSKDLKIVMKASGHFPSTSPFYPIMMIFC